MRLVIIHDSNSNETLVYSDESRISYGMQEIKFCHKAGKNAELCFGFIPLHFKKQEGALQELHNSGKLLEVLGVTE